MNESHAGTERAKGWKRSLKRWLVGRFHAALVGGTPQKRHFAALGMDEATIFTGYDAIDDGFFAGEAARVREDPEGWRKRLGLPDRYILSLGRMVGKKNLGCLVEAYAALRQRLGDATPALVLVGSGDQEPALRGQCIELGLQIVDPIPDGRIPLKTENLKLNTHPSSVWMPGFRQIHENPAFYALAECFVLPSLWEEWGLVVNEAMACGLPVVVSQTAGCAEDLVKIGENGFLFDPTRPEELTNALATLALDPGLRERMGAESRQIISRWGCGNFARNALAAIQAVNA
jgi:1,2-diacylglycerol 3-alpha-glucosyltransferase